MIPTTSLARALCAALLALPALAVHAGGELPPAPGDEATDRLILHWRDARVAAGATALPRLDGAHAAARRWGVQMRELRRTASGAQVMQLDRRLPLGQAQALAAQVALADPALRAAEPDRIATIQWQPGDPRFAEQWHAQRAAEEVAAANLPPAWDLARGAGVVVAVIDTGVRPHAEYAARLLQGHDFVGDLRRSGDGNGRDTDASDPGDHTYAGECGTGQPARASSWHGTHVAGLALAAAGNGVGGAGTAPQARLLPVRAIGKCGGYASDIADAIVWAAGGAVNGVPANANPARVLNLSMAGSGSCSGVIGDAVAAARTRGAVVVAAAGNGATDAAGVWPANCPGVIAVAALNRAGARAYYSNHGTVVTLAAPGGDMRTSNAGGILSTFNAGTTTPGADSYAFLQGTSMATPQVAGAAALLLSRDATLSADDVAALLRQGARPFAGSCAGCGAGMLDVQRALASLAQPAAAPIEEAARNGTRERAQMLSANPALVAGRMDASDDIDWYGVTLAAGATLQVSLQPQPQVDLSLFGYDDAGVQRARSSAGPGLEDRITLTNTGSAPADFYLRVRWVSGNVAGEAGAYTLRVAQ